jgi:hypothetical protein
MLPMSTSSPKHKTEDFSTLLFIHKCFSRSSHSEGIKVNKSSTKMTMVVILLSSLLLPWPPGVLKVLIVHVVPGPQLC